VTVSQLPLPRSLPQVTLRRLLLLYPFASWAGRSVGAAFSSGAGWPSSIGFNNRELAFSASAAGPGSRGDHLLSVPAAY
jgi:hypothetical protein